MANDSARLVQCLIAIGFAATACSTNDGAVVPTPVGGGSTTGLGDSGGDDGTGAGDDGDDGAAADAEAAGMFFESPDWGLGRQLQPYEPCDRSELGQRMCDLSLFQGGVGVADYDRDGYLDVLFTSLADGARLLHNEGGQGFVDVTASSGLGGLGPTAGVAWGDVDEDGDLDVVMTTVGYTPPQLWINEGGTFVEEGAEHGFVFPGIDRFNGAGVAFGDVDRDGDLDLYLAEWSSAETSAMGGRLLRNLGPDFPGVFEDITEAMGIAGPWQAGEPGTWEFSPAFIDLDGDGWLELAVASDFGSTRLYWNDEGTLREGAVLAGVQTNRNAMGSTFGDVNRDGYMDWYISDIGYAELGGQTDGARAPGSRLYINRGDRTFEDQTSERGVRYNGWGWGTTFFDADNDGDLDLAATNGTLDDFAYDPAQGEDHDLLFLQRADGTFVDVSERIGLTDRTSGRGLVAFDADRDGRLDVVVHYRDRDPVLYRNVSEKAGANDYLSVEVRELSGRPAHGARVRVTGLFEDSQVAVVGAGAHFLSSGPDEVHFGLGEGVDTVSVRVEWMDGTVEEISGVPTRQHLVIEHP